MGNSRARAVYEANLPDNFRRPQTDSSLEAFVRSKYETKKFIAKEWVPPPMPKPSFEFEEEKKKTKEKRVKSTSHSGLEVPLPSTVGTKKSPPPSVSAHNADSQNPQSKPDSMMDLLGLNDPAPQPSVTTPVDDPFGGFLSATTSVATNGFATSSTSDSPNRTVDNGANEVQTNGGIDGVSKNQPSDQENLFAQMSNEQLLQKKQQQPLSKESILSLYGQGPTMQQQPTQRMGMPAGGMFMGMQQTQQQQQQQQQQANMFVNPGQLPSFGGYGNLPVGVGGVMPPAGMVGGAQANVMGTNPFLVSGSIGAIGGGWFTGATNPPTHSAFGQLQQQMASMSVNGQGFSNVSIQPPFGVGTVPQAFGSGAAPQAFVSGPVPQIPSATLPWGSQQPGQTLSTNLWQ